jgi:hypothetical protein
LETDTNVEYGTLPTYDGENPRKDLNYGKVYKFT